MVSTWPPTCKSSRPFNNPLVTVPKAPITIGIIVTFMFHSFFNSLARSRYLSILLLLLLLFNFQLYFWFLAILLQQELGWGKVVIICVLRIYVFCCHFRMMMMMMMVVLLLFFIIIIFTLWEFFTSALTDGLSLESEWQQDSSGLQDSS